MRGVNTRFWEMLINGLRELKIDAGKPKVLKIGVAKMCSKLGVLKKVPTR